MIACLCPLARLVTLEVDRSLWRDPNFRRRLRSLLQGTRVTYVTETFCAIISISRTDSGALQIKEAAFPLPAEHAAQVTVRGIFRLI